MRRQLQSNAPNDCGLEPAHAPAFLTPDPLQVTCPSPFGKVPTNSTMKHIPLTVFVITLLGWAFFYSLTQTLDDLTQRDCEAGVVKACEALAGSK